MYTSRWKSGRFWLRVTVVAAAVVGVGAIAYATFIPVANGNIDPNIIQIDPSANLYNNAGDSTAALNAPANVDWVHTFTGTSDTDCITDTGTGNCYVAGVTAASGGQGSWYGVRIVDGFDGNDQNIFLRGGKENDFSTWHIGPGTIGSSKYDMTQAYIANNQSTLFFGMERLGNNGTTAFDFEFNQYAPGTVNASVNCSAFPDFPCRAAGDVLITFEVSGSGGSGSDEPHYFTWNATTHHYDEGSFPSDAFASVNNSATPAGPWGYVNASDQWALGDIPKFEFAEAAIGLNGTTLPGAGGCGGKAYVQIRTRASVTDNSDLKDGTRIFEYQFGSLAASASKDGDSTGTNAVLTASATLSGSSTTASFQWQVFQSSNANCDGTEGDDDCWTNLGTGSPFNYNFSTGASTTTGVTMSIATDGGTDSYKGEILSARVRVVATKTVGTSTCAATSSALTVKRALAVDP